MFDTLLKYKSSLIGLVAIVALFYGYTVYGPEELPEELVFSTSNDVQGELVGEEIIQSLNRVRAISFKTQVLEHPLLSVLVDRAATVTPESKNRRNPFEPVGFGVDNQGFVATPIPIEQFISGNFDEEESPVDDTIPSPFVNEVEVDDDVADDVDTMTEAESGEDLVEELETE